MMNQQQIREKLTTDKTLSKSQKKHLKHVIKSRDRRDKHIDKQITEQACTSKLIEENHNGHDYSPEFTEKARDHYMDYLWKNWMIMCDDPNRWLYCFQKMRLKIQTLLLHWSPDYQRGPEFWYFKELLDTYRDNKTNGDLLLSVTYNGFKKLGKFENL